MTDETTTYNAINVGLSAPDSLRIPTSDISIDGIGQFEGNSYAERAEELRRDSGNPPAVIGGFEKTEENFHPLEVWDEVPHVDDSYKDRQKKRHEGGWKDEELFLNLYHRKFGRFNQREAESILAIKFAFAYGKHPEIIAYEMENLPFPTVYFQDPWQRRSVLDFAQKAESIYCDGVGLVTKMAVAQAVQERGITTVPHLAEDLDWGEDQIRRSLSVLDVEGWIDRERSDRRSEPDTWSDRGITEDYLDSILEDKRRLEQEK